MEYSLEQNLVSNDNQFIKESYNNLAPENVELNGHPLNIYNPALFQPEIIIKFFQMKGILNKSVICTKCGKLCKMVKENQSIDKFIWRCRCSNPSHDVKINIRKNSILENMHLNIQILYFLIFFCFTEKKSINDSLIESTKYAEALGICGTTKQSIINIYAILRKKLKDTMHFKWSQKMLAEDPNENGYSTIEID